MLVDGTVGVCGETAATIRDETLRNAITWLGCVDEYAAGWGYLDAPESHDPVRSWDDARGYDGEALKDRLDAFDDGLFCDWCGGKAVETEGGRADSPGRGNGRGRGNAGRQEGRSGRGNGNGFGKGGGPNRGREDGRYTDPETSSAFARARSTTAVRPVNAIRTRSPP